MLLCCAATASDAQPPQAIPAPLPALTNPMVRNVGPDLYQIGKVTLDQSNRSITLPAVLNKSQGLMEYLLVTTYGKTHESILKTEAQPQHIHIAMLLLGAGGPGNPVFPGAPSNGIPGPIIHPSAKTIPGDKVAIVVQWKTTDGLIRRPAGDLVLNTNTQAAIPAGPWVYNGSLMVNNRFLAQVDGSLVSLVTDPVALVNYTGRGHDDDTIWIPRVPNLPPPDCPVEVTITLQDPPK